MKSTLGTITTVVASILVGCTAAIAIASTAAVSEVAPSLRQEPAGVVRLDPVTVTVSKAYYDAVRLEDVDQLARTDAKKVTRG